MKLVVALSLILGTVFSSDVICGNEFLVVLPSAQTVEHKTGQTSRTGLPFEELASPLRALHNRGFRQIFATPSGSNEPIMHPKITLEGREKHNYWKTVDESVIEMFKMQDRLKNLLMDEPTFRKPLKLSLLTEEELERFTGILLAGGEGSMTDLHKDPALATILAHFQTNNKPVLAIGHAVCALSSAKNLFKGYQMTGINEEEQHWDHEGKPHSFLVKEKIQEMGAQYKERDVYDSHVVRDRNLLTAQGLYSSSQFGRAISILLDELCPPSKVQPHESSFPLAPWEGAYNIGKPRWTKH